MSMPLEGIRVIDWTLWQMGPICSALLGDLGADVIKIEQRAKGDPGRGVKRARGRSLLLPANRNAYFETNNRNKRGLAVDLTKEAGREIIYRLVEQADVFVQNFRSGVAQRLHLDYDTLSRYNPRLIYANASGYGPKGPESGRPSLDYLGLARSGIMTAVPTSDGAPVEINGSIADQMGAVLLAYGVLAALVARERLGVGQEVDSSHLGSMIALQGLHIGISLLINRDLEVWPRTKAQNPLWNHYQCGDGQWIALGLLQSDRYWHDFCGALHIEHLEKDSRFESMDKRADNCAELISILDKVFATKTYEQWADILKENEDFIFTVVQARSDLATDRQVIANEYITEYDHPVLGKVKMVGCPVKFSKTPPAIRLPAPEFGEHTEEILLEIGYTWDDIARLREEEVL